MKLASSEKLTNHEFEDLKNLNMNNQIFSSFNDIRNLLLTGSLSTNPCAFFKLFPTKFFSIAHFTIISHIRLNKEAEQETRLQMNFLRNFNLNIEVTDISDSNQVDPEFISEILSKYEEIERITQDETIKYRITQLNDLETCITTSLKDIDKCSPGLTPFEFFYFNNRLIEQSERIKFLLKSLEGKRKELQIGSRTLDKYSNNSQSNTSSNSRHTLTSIDQVKPTSAGASDTTTKGNPFSKLIFKFFESDINTTKVSLAGDGRCPVCTLCIPCKHYDSLQKVSTETKSNCSNTRRQTPLTRSVYEKPSQRDKDAENFEPVKPSSVPHSNRRTVETKDPNSRSNIDSNPSSENRNLVNHIHATPSFKIRTRRGNPLGELRNIPNENKETSKAAALSSEEKTLNIMASIKCEKLMNQLRLEEYQEKRVLDAINGMDENKCLEELLKKESENQVVELL
jgi:hypothetical protein